jgi:broad specificity phosphatase PhoE
MTHAVAQRSEPTPGELPSAIRGPARVPAGPVLMVRHGQTDPGIGDPPGFVLSRCATQRNLAPEGRAQSVALGAALAGLGLTVASIRTSRWCRCVHTGELIAQGFGRPASSPVNVMPWAALDSVFVERDRAAAQNVLLRQRLDQLMQAAAVAASPGVEVWVTHGANVLAFTGKSPAPAQAHWLVVDRDAVQAIAFEANR